MIIYPKYILPKLLVCWFAFAVKLENSVRKLNSIPSKLLAESKNNLKNVFLLSSYAHYFSNSILTAKADENLTSREDVDLIDLNAAEPRVTDTCWMDIQISESPPRRIEIALYGDVIPITSKNFKDLCSNKLKFGYRGSEIFRIVSSFTIQGGNVISSLDSDRNLLGEVPLSSLGKYGHSADDLPFEQENFKILHSYKDAGVISMMKDIQNSNKQDSRFFITTEPSAGWADGKYVAFGRVIKGIDLLKDLSALEVVPPVNYPKSRVKIVDSGVY